jgi:hypothetical protein
MQAAAPYLAESILRWGAKDCCPRRLEDGSPLIGVGEGCGGREGHLSPLAAYGGDLQAADTDTCTV